MAFLAFTASKTKNMLVPEFSLPIDVKIMKKFQKSQILDFGLWFGLQKFFSTFFQFF